MSDLVCASPLDRVTDFQVLYDPVTQTTARRFGTCGPTAVAMALSSALGRAVSLQDTYSWERSHGWTDSTGYHTWADESGASTLTSGVRCAGGLGAAIAESSGYIAGWSGWWNFILRHAGRNPGVVETSVGQVLVDLISTAGENATNLQNHFFAFLAYHPGGVVTFAPYAGKILPEGVFVADGASFAGGNSNQNNFNAANQLQFYSKDNIAQAQLIGGFALVGRATMLQLADTNGLFIAQADGTWYCPETKQWIGGGNLVTYRTMVALGTANGLTTLSLPLTGEIPVGKPKAGSTAQPTVQIFKNAALVYDPDRVLDNPFGSVGYNYLAHIEAPYVLAVYAPPAPVPAPVAPVVSFGAANISQSADAGDVKLTVTLPFSVK